MFNGLSIQPASDFEVQNFMCCQPFQSVISKNCKALNPLKRAMTKRF